MMQCLATPRVVVCSDLRDIVLVDETLRKKRIGLFRLVLCCNMEIIGDDYELIVCGLFPG